MASVCSSLVFDCEVLLDNEQSQEQRMLDQLESVVLPALERSSRPASPLARDILGIVNGFLAGRAGPVTQEELPLLARVLAANSANSFDVVIRSALSTNGVECFKSLRHSFLVVRGRGEYEGMEFIVEPALRSHFTIPHPSPEYEQMLARAPDVFVGGSCRLVPLVQLLCALMADSFERQGLALPPWRKEAAMLSKWMPSPGRTRDTPVVARAHSATAALELQLAPHSTTLVPLPTTSTAGAAAMTTTAVATVAAVTGSTSSPFVTCSVISAAGAGGLDAVRGAAVAAQPINLTSLARPLSGTAGAAAHTACNAVFGFGIAAAAGGNAHAATGLTSNIESSSCCGGLDSGYVASDASALLTGGCGGTGFGGLPSDVVMMGFDSTVGDGKDDIDSGGVFSLGCSPDGELPLPLPRPRALAAGGSSRKSLLPLRPAVHLGFEPSAPAAAAAAAALSVWGGSPSPSAAQQPPSRGAVVAGSSCGSSSGSSFGGRGTGLLSAKLQRCAAAAAPAPASGSCQQPRAAPQPAPQPQRVIETRPPAYQGEMCIRVVKLVGFNVPAATATGTAAATSIAAAAAPQAQALRA